MNFHHFARYSAIAVTLALLGCGGGGDGGGGPQQSHLFDEDLPPIITTNAAPAIGKAADAQPRADGESSITQSSNVSDGITTDSITVEVEYGDSQNRYSISNGSLWEINMGEGNPQILEDSPLPKVSGLTYDIDGGTLHVAVSSNIKPPTAETTTQSIPDADYLVGGIWLLVPSDESSAEDYVFGTFADGSDPFEQSNLMALRGTASYAGLANGIYSGTDDTGTEIGSFNGNVVLMADFGDATGLGTISGSITNIAVNGDRTMGEINLGTADIGNSNSGFFAGGLTGSDDEERSYSGHWGGQFYGETDGMPGSVAGTFGGSSTDDMVNFVGAFGASKQ